MDVVPAYGEARQVYTGILCKRSEVKSEISCLWSRHEDLLPDMNNHQNVR